MGSLTVSDRPYTGSTSASQSAHVFSALSQETRLETYRLLSRYQPYGLAAGDIARLLAVPHNTLSTHLAILEHAGLVRSRRAGRSKIYCAVMLGLTAAIAYLDEGDARMPGQGILDGEYATGDDPFEYPDKREPMERRERCVNVLVLCTENSTRSILAEAILNRESAGRIQAFSAGSNPAAQPNPVALEFLGSLGYDTSTLRSKSWKEFAGRSAPRMDVIVTVCDRAANERCPKWPGTPLTFHWGVPKLAAAGQQQNKKRAAVEMTYRLLMNRVTTFVNLPLNRLQSKKFTRQMQNIGLMAGASELSVARNNP